MSTNIKFSILIRYVLQGFFSLIVIFATLSYIDMALFDHSISFLEQLFGFASLKYTKGAETMIKADDNQDLIKFIIALLLCFIAGIAMNGVRLAFMQFVRWLSGKLRIVRKIHLTGFGDGCNFWLFQWLIRLLFPTYYYNTFNYCRVIHNLKNVSSHYPNWVFISKRPELLSEIIDNISGNAGKDDDRLYMNELVTTMIMIVHSCLFALLLTGNFIQIYTLILLVCDSLLILCAKAYADDYIRSLGVAFKSLTNDNIRQYNNTMVLLGAPKAYILVRTKNCEENYLANTLKSIENQTYCNNHIIILEDFDDKNQENDDSIRKTVLEYQNFNEHPSIAHNITYCKTKCGSPAAAMNQIRKLFLNTAGDDDIAIILDDDDEFLRKNAVEDIVVNMQKGKANMCITTFETKGDIGKDITNGGGRIHNNVVRKLENRSQKGICPNRAMDIMHSLHDHLLKFFNSKTPIKRRVPDFCYSSSIGWTKAYRKDMVSWYDELLENTRYKDLRKYEDFPDFINFLSKKVVITGVSEPTHSYFKRSNRVTTQISTPRDFSECRAGNLQLLLGLVEQNIDKLNRKSYLYTREFILFKMCQIEDIFYGTRRDNLKKIEKRHKLKKNEAKLLDEWKQHKNKTLYFSECVFEEIRNQKPTRDNAEEVLKKFCGSENPFNLDSFKDMIAENMRYLTSQKILNLKNKIGDICNNMS